MSSLRSTTLAIALVAVAATAQETVPTITGKVRVERLATLEFPWALAYLPDGRLLITEKPGRLRIWSKGSMSEPVAGVPTVAYRGQGGLQGIAVDPGFAQNQTIYLYYAEAADPQPANLSDTAESRFGQKTASPDATLKGGAVARARLTANGLTDVTVIWRQVPKMIGRGHFGGRIVVAADGKLFITSGERMRFDPAQDMASNLGKVVRINTDGSIPADNPFVKTEKARGDIWTLGHRNMLAAAINPATGALWVVEMGPLGGDELNRITAGKNYGWPVVSNGDNYDSSTIPDHPAREEFQAPVRSWTPVISPSGMIFYTGSMFPAWRGSALVGGLSSKALIRLSFDGDAIANEERINLGRRIRDVVQAPDGAVLVIVDDPKGDLLRLTPAK